MRDEKVRVRYKSSEGCVRVVWMKSEGGNVSTKIVKNVFGFVKDNKEAVLFFTLAAQHGHSGAQYNLGLCLPLNFNKL